VVLGLFMASNVANRPGRKRLLLKVHQQIAIAGLCAIGAHGVFLLADKVLHPGVVGITVPFALGYRPLWTGLGILSGYAALVLGPTYYLRRRIGARRWRQVHRLTVIAYLLAVAHSLGSGTDGAALGLQVIVIGSAIPIAFLLVLRYRPRPQRQGVPAQGPAASSGSA
jgi:sulfoxide reductase heme-binding subunit YedZ